MQPTVAETVRIVGPGRSRPDSLDLDLVDLVWGGQYHSFAEALVGDRLM